MKGLISCYAQRMITILIISLLATFFMMFLQWLAQDSKDPFARKLRILGWTGVVIGWTIVLLYTLHQIPQSFDVLP